MNHKTSRFMSSETASTLTDRTLRILMLAPTPYFADRGCHVRIYEEARALVEQGHQVCIVTYGLGRDMPAITTVRTPHLPWYTKLEAGPSWHKPLLDLLLLVTAYKTARRFRPHLIHAHLHEGVMIGYILKKLVRRPLLFDYQGSLTGESLSHGFFREKSLLHRMFSLLERWLDSCADMIITSSSAGEKELQSLWGVPVSRVSTLIDGVDTDIFQPLPKLAPRQQLGIPEQAKVIVYLGLFNQYQGIDLLLDALVIVMEQDPAVHALLMGFPEEAYIQKAAQLGIAEKITFTGRVPYDLAATYLSAGDVAVSPKLSITEANGKLFNYMACALPTVAFESPVNREIMGEHAYYADYGSTQSFAEQIMTALQAIRDQQLGLRARERAVTYHSWKVRGTALLGKYQTMISTNMNS